MIGKKKMSNNQVSTILGQGAEIVGDVTFSGGLHIDGVVKGNVTGTEDSDAVLTLSELGSIEGEVRVPVIILNGAIKGDVFASERVELASKARVTGNVSYNLIEMAVGAEVNGKLAHLEESASISLISDGDMTAKSSSKVG
ncbi:MAG: cell shape determination protein CcmA [Gammaproteobacteria bacterium]|nr:MAG: cell shape determination protein CcmA [Gammaproteobacteria bacterium]RLA24216.1 MAG: cell shape determination protein CcmA [Gammaproteobacteria bacterium]